MKVTVKKRSGGNENKLPITTEFIKLEAALKLANATASGGMAKAVIQDELVTVNGEICTMRGKKLYPGDKVCFEGITYLICKNEAE